VSTVDRAARVAATAAVVLTVSVVGSCLVVWGGRGFPELPLSFVRGPLGIVEIALISLVYALSGAFMIGRVPSLLIGSSLIVIGLGVALHLPASLLVDQAIATFRPVAQPLLLFAWALTSILVPLAAALIAMLVMVLPDGRLPSRRWRPVVGITVVGSILLALGTALTPSGLTWFPTLPNPLSLPSSFGSTAMASRIVGVGLLAFGLLIAVACLIGRYRGGDALLRVQLRWILGGAALWATSLAALLFSRYLVVLPESQGSVLVHLAAICTIAMPVTIVLATIRHHLFGADVIVGRTLVYVPLMAICAGVYTAGVALSQRLFITATGNTSDVAIVLATLLAAGAFMPVRRWLETLVDRLTSTVVADARPGTPAERSAERAAEQDALTEQAEVLTARLAEIERRLTEIRSSSVLDHGAAVGEPGVGGAGWQGAGAARPGD
jgi:hypothetical protein